jgi:hypothetical protein
MMEAASTSKTLVNYHTTRRYNPEDSLLRNTELVVTCTHVGNNFRFRGMHWAVERLKELLCTRVSTYTVIFDFLLSCYSFFAQNAGSECMQWSSCPFACYNSESTELISISLRIEEGATVQSVERQSLQPWRWRQNVPPKLWHTYNQNTV